MHLQTLRHVQTHMFVTRAVTALFRRKSFFNIQSFHTTTQLTTNTNTNDLTNNNSSDNIGGLYKSYELCERLECIVTKPIRPLSINEIINLPGDTLKASIPQDNNVDTQLEAKENIITSTTPPLSSSATLPSPVQLDLLQSRNSHCKVTSRILHSASWAQREIPLRLAHRLRDFSRLPFVVVSNPHVNQVFELYCRAFRVLYEHGPIVTIQSEEMFTQQLRNIVIEHAGVVALMQRGVSSLKVSHPDIEIDGFLDRLFGTRIGNRILAETHIAFHDDPSGFISQQEKCHHILRREECKSNIDQKHDNNNNDATVNNNNYRHHISKDNNRLEHNEGLYRERNNESLSNHSMQQRYKVDSSEWHRPHSNSTDRLCLENIVVGVIHQQCRPYSVISEVANKVQQVAMCAYGCSPPEVHITGDEYLTFPYIPEHLKFICFEMLKNSIRATIEHHALVSAGAGSLPPISVGIHKGQKDVVIKITDQGGGLSSGLRDEIWQYGFSSVSKSPTLVPSTSSISHPIRRDKREIAGYGFGLPLSRLYCRYFGGDLDIKFMSGYGTDTYIFLPRLGNQRESEKMLNHQLWWKSHTNHSNNTPSPADM